MKNTLVKLALALSLVILSGSLFTAFGVYLFRQYSVSPTFPYYYNLLLYTKDAAYALWGYFDGVHYLRLAETGYVDTGTQAFFPLYPLLVSALSESTGLSAYVSAVLLSSLALTLSLYVLWLLFPKTKLRATLTLLLFPTSFFFFAVYTESLYLLLSLLFFYFLSKERYFFAALVSALASSTRLVGIILALILCWQLLTRHKTTKPALTLGLSLLSLSGFLAYVYFLYREFNDPLMFLHVQEMFGANRSGGELILLPQVLYRYFKMIITVEPHTLMYQRLWIELTFFLGSLWLWFRNLKVQVPAYSFYVLASLLLPTLTGTLSSLPRYLLVLTPFLLPPKLKTPLFSIFLSGSFILLLYLFTLFAHGTFVA